MGLILYGLVTLKLITVDLWNNDYWYRSAIWISLVIVLYLTAILFYKKEGPNLVSQITYHNLFTLLIIAANVLTILAGSREISIFFNNQLPEPPSYNSSFQRNYQSLYSDYSVEANKLKDMASLCISFYWLVYAIVLLVIGFVKKIKWSRLGGLLLLIISIIKIFFVDLWDLGTLYRIFAFMGLGVVLLVISFAYQKNKDKIKELIIE
jgi:hypothetical protein